MQRKAHSAVHSCNCSNYRDAKTRLNYLNKETKYTQLILYLRVLFSTTLLQAGQRW